MGEIRFQVVKDRDVSLRFPMEVDIPNWLLAAIFITSIPALYFVFLSAADTPLWVRVPNRIVDGICFYYLAKVAYHAVVIETEYKFKLTSRRWWLPWT